MRTVTSDFGSPKARMFDFLYSDISPDGIYNRLRKNGHVYEFVSDKEIERIGLIPPQTRAAIRARYMTKVFENNFPHLYSQWHCLHGPEGVPLNDPFATTSEALERLLENGALPQKQYSVHPEDFGDLF
ncbi:MAG: proteasome accessory factor PafA2 family protein [Candidatus Sungbacteria bacterium]|nr:proteasome accessory factor PafA2 family protein [Candidatus Sungbacteria bacterium]